MHSEDGLGGSQFLGPNELLSYSDDEYKDKDKDTRSSKQNMQTLPLVVLAQANWDAHCAQCGWAGGSQFLEAKQLLASPIPAIRLFGPTLFWPIFLRTVF